MQWGARRPRNAAPVLDWRRWGAEWGASEVRRLVEDPQDCLGDGPPQDGGAEHYWCLLILGSTASSITKVPLVPKSKKMRLNYLWM